MDTRGAEVAKVQRELQSLVKSSGAVVPAVQRLEEKMKAGENGSELIAQLCLELDTFKLELDTYSKLFKELKASRKVLADSLSQQQVEEALEYTESKQKALFEKYFGMKFKLTEDRAIIVEFRHLAPAQPDLMCSIVLDINAGDHWEVVKVTPPLAPVTALLQQLNKTGNLGQFLKVIRTHFKQHLLTNSNAS